MKEYVEGIFIESYKYIENFLLHCMKHLKYDSKT